LIAQRLRRWIGRADSGAEGVTPEAAQLSILMVCMGNICRSPTAEGVLRAKLERAGLQALVHVDSAGTIGNHEGEPPDPRAIRHAAQRGYDIAGLRARPVGDDDFTRFDWILAMDEDNLRWLRKRLPASGGPRLELLMASATGHADVREVPDPYYGTAAGFQRVLALVEDACDGLVVRMQAELDTAPGSSPILD
jgi:protein-tyrosine phosphatase